MVELSFKFLAIWGLPLFCAALAAGLFASGPMSRARVERFARRQRLDITVANGEQVIRYLATTRRWRVAGFATGWALAQFVGPRAGEISTGAEYITVFAGWFLGALVAEVRTAHLEYGSVRAASLAPRGPQRYVRRFAWALVPGAAVLAAAAAGATVVAAVVGWADPDWAEAGVWLGLALIAAATVRLIQHAVLRRAQPLAAPDVIAADDAIRSRALHVLSGGGAALVLFLVLNQLGAIHPHEAGHDSRITAIRIVGSFIIAGGGWLVATSLWPPPQRTGHRRLPAAGTA